MELMEVALCLCASGVADDRVVDVFCVRVFLERLLLYSGLMIEANSKFRSEQ